MASCVDLHRNCISLPADITKGKKGRYVFFSVRTGKVLRRWLQYKDRYRDSEYLFCTNEGRPLQISNFEANIRDHSYYDETTQTYHNCSYNEAIYFLAKRQCERHGVEFGMTEALLNCPAPQVNRFFENLGLYT